VGGLGRSRSAPPRAGTKPRDSAYDAAARYLASRPRSVLEVRRHLIKRRYDEREVTGALDRLRAAGYLDDAAFARYWLDQRARFKPKGVLGLRSELRAKGVSPSVIGAVLTEAAEDRSEADTATEALSSRLARWRNLPDDERKARAQAFLRQRGFRFDVIEEVLERL
jgi:regulatory protein